jgi:hypothetical protein
MGRGLSLVNLLRLTNRDKRPDRAGILMLTVGSTGIRSG